MVAWLSLICFFFFFFFFFFVVVVISLLGSSVGCAFTWLVDGRRFDLRVRQHSFVAIGHEIISTAILSLPLFQVGQLSVTGKRTG